jgi:6-pyruvoyltetrahydropterin/6-carboxytetrahydropterin synthase
MMRVIKTYGNEQGWSASFRQHSATSHCRFIHGYAIGVELEFCCLDSEVDKRGWVINFGGLKPVKAWLQDLLDHKYLAAADDPLLPKLAELDEAGLIQLRILAGGVGCDNLARHIANYVDQWLQENRVQLDTQAWLSRVKVFEHPGNAAEWTR